MKSVSPANENQTKMPEKTRLPSFNSPRKSSILKKTKIPTISPCTIPKSIPKLDFLMEDSEKLNSSLSPVNTENADSIPDSLNNRENRTPSPSVPDERENSTVKIYLGSNFFWRFKLTLDCHIYHHSYNQILELIAIDVDTGNELPRLYMNFSDVVKNISSNKNTLGSINENFDKYLSNPDHQEIMGKHIVQSLQIIPTEDGITTLEYIPTIQVNHGENFDKNSSFNVSKPHDILPAKVKGRRRASIADCKAARESLSSDISNLITATSEAQKTADLIGMSTDALNGIAKKYEKLRKANYSKCRMLWVRAIRKVIIQLEVAKITKILESYEQKKKAFLIEKYSKTKIAVLGQSLKILVVDQSHASLTRTARALENCKHVVSKESSGIKASETLQNISFDLIIIDFCSPDIPAENIITKFREHELTQEIEKKTIIIGLIDHHKAPENINQTDFVSKINAFLIKPFTLSKLEEILESIDCQI